MSKTATEQILSALPRLAAVALLVLSPAAMTGCSDDAGGGEGASCETSQDCQKDLLCRSGACVPKQDNNGVGPDAGDAGQDGDSGGGNQTLEPEDYAISYLVDDQKNNERRLMVYNTADNTHTQVSPEGHGCPQGCWLSEDMSTFVWVEAIEGENRKYNVYKAPVSDLQVQGDGELFVEGVARARIAGNTVTYSKDQGGQMMAYYKPLDGGAEVGLGGLGTSAAGTGGWFIAPEADQGVRYTYTLQTMDLSFGPLDGPLDSSTFTLDAQNHQQTGGSFFGESMPVAISPDGKLAAFVTEAPNAYGQCEEHSDCSGPVQFCGRFKRCTAIELTAHIVELAKVDELGGPCGGEGTCGDFHTCDMPGDDPAVYTCIPKRVVLGMPVRPQQKAHGDDVDSKTGCELTEGNPDWHYTTLGGPITFDNDGNLYGAAARDCAPSDNVGDSDILKIDPRAGSYEVVWGNPDTGFDPDACYDFDALEVSDENCVPYIDSARLSPAKNEIAFLATTPHVTSPELAANSTDLWTVMRNGEDHAWVGESDSTQINAVEFHVHPLP